MRRLVVAALAAALVATLGAPAITVGGQERVPVCHLNDVGGYQLIEIAEPAFDSHVAHGDGGFHEPVPGQPGYVFDSSCVPEPIIVRFTTLDANGRARLLVQWEDTNADAVPSVGDTIRTGEFPAFTSPTTWDYVPAQVTAFPVTAIDSLYKYDGSLPWLIGDFGIMAHVGYATFQFSRGIGLEQYWEFRPWGDTVARSGVADSKDGDKWEHDWSSLCLYSPSRPYRDPCTYTSGYWTNDLVQIELYW